LLLFLGNSCNLDSLDFNKLSDDVNLSPALVAPVAKANITVWDLIHSANKDNEDVITKDPITGLVKIIYKQNDLYKYNVRDFLSLPRIQNLSSGNNTLGEVSPSDVSIGRSVTLNELTQTLTGAVNNIATSAGQNVIFQPYTFNGPTVKYSVQQIDDFTSITLSKGSLEIKLENKMPIPITLTGSLYDKTKQQVIANITFTDIAPNSSSMKPYTLDGKQLSNQIEFQLSTFSTPGSAPTPVLINLSDYFNLTFDLKGLKVSNGNLMVKAQNLDGFSGVFGFTFDSEPDMKAFSVVLKTGKMNIKANNSSQLTGSVNFVLSQFKKNGAPISSSISLNGTSTTIDLAGAVLNLASDAAIPYNRIPYTYSVQVNKSNGFITYNSTDAVKMDISLTDLDFKSVQGDFGKQKITIDPGKFDMDVDMLSKIDGSFKLSNPVMNLIFHNSIGVPANVSLELNASNKANTKVSLKRNPAAFALPIPASINAGIKTETVAFTKQNSNIVDFVALPPTGQITYSGQVDFNPSTSPITLSNPNFLDLDATFAIDLAMELPLELQISNLVFKDTTEISGDDFDKLETAEMILTANNGIPLDVELQLAFVDTIAKKQFGVSKKTKILTAAQVNAADNKITAVKSTNTFSLDKTDLENLRKSNGIVFSGSVSSPASGASVATIWSDSKIELSVIIKSKLNL